MRVVRRFFLLLLGLTTFVGLVHGQEQEGKLIDRLLRPDLSLTNSQQNKKFIAAEGTSVDRKFKAKSFSGTKDRSTKDFLGIRSFFAKNFGTNKFSRSDWAANAATSSTPSYAQAAVQTKKSALIKTSSEAKKVARTRDYPDKRPFLGKGTRQKILSQQDHPLSIEEIRQLLNRDKPPDDSP